MKLNIILLNWNALDDTRHCLDTINTWRNIQTTTYVVDNASTDGSADIIARTYPDTVLIRNERNLGFAGGNNRALAIALQKGNVPILLLNNDAYIAETDVIRLLGILRAAPDIGAVGPLLFDAAEPERLLSAGGRSPLHHQTHILTLSPGPPLRTVDYIPGTVIIIKADVFRQVGLLDEDYFFATEVADLCLSAKRAGYLTVIDTEARAYHMLARSSNLRHTLHTYYIIRNRFLYIRKFHPRTKIPLNGVWGAYSLALALKEHLSGHPATARAMWLGFSDGIRGWFGGQNARVLAYCEGAGSDAPTG
ncbi:MAG: glycosyltransferase family 2 protein [Anaerolineae bacterium]|nr:glycosyltransferase family 2 protein [Anaerolineae bacterium]